MYSDVNCTSAVSGADTSGSGDITSVDGTATTLNVAAGAGQFIKLTAPASAGGQSFVDWTSTSGGGTFTTSDSGRSICAAGEANSGLRRFTATYAAPVNSAPAIAATNASVTVNEGQTANNSGTWSDANAGDTVTLSASVGTVAKSGTNAAGTWSWSYATTDGPAQSQTVTITANDGNGGVHDYNVRADREQRRADGGWPVGVSSPINEGSSSSRCR